MYKDYYQLTSNPFQMTPSANIFFAGKTHLRGLSYLQYGLAQHDGFVILSGKMGIGKTTIIKKFISGLDTHNYIAKQVLILPTQEQDLLTIICKAFDLISEGLTQAVLLKQFQAFLKSLDKLGRKVVLIIDDAHHLSLTMLLELESLSKFQINNKPVMQSFLFGEKELIAQLKTDTVTPLRQRVIASCQLKPLSQEELRDYINYRLKKANWKGKELFDDHAFVLIYEVTMGIPRRINIFCDRILLFGYLEKISYFNAEHIKHVAAEVADEVTNPIKVKKPVIDVKNNTQPIQPRQKKPVHDVSVSSDFVDIEETIRDFELRIEQEIQEFKNSVKS